MIITMTGVPCSGKSTSIEVLKKKYGFDSISTGELYRKEAEKFGLNVLDFNILNTDYSIDKKIDAMSKKIGTERANDKLIFDSRMAWYFVPKSFKVFLYLPEDEMAKRLYESDRSPEEKNMTIEQAKKSLVDRFKSENDRYKKLYGVSNTNHKNYDLVIDTEKLTPEEVADIVYDKYLEYIKKNSLSE